MEYSSRSGQHYNYAHTMSDQLGRLSLSPAGPSEAGSRHHHHHHSGYLQTQQLQEPEQHQQQHIQHHQLYHQQNPEALSYSSGMAIKSRSYVSHRQLPSPAQNDYSSKPLNAFSLAPPQSSLPSHSHSQTSSPLRTGLGAASLSSVTPRAEQDVGVSLSSQSLRQARLEGAQLASSLPSHLTSSLPSKMPTSLPSHLTASLPSHSPTSLPSHQTTSLQSHLPTSLPSHPTSNLLPQLPANLSSRQQPSTLPYVPTQLGLQDGMGSAQMGLTWDSSTNGQVKGYTHLHAASVQQSQHSARGSLAMLEVNQYANQSFVNGQMGHTLHMQQTFQPHFSSQMQYSNLEYGSQQQQYNFDQLQSFPQNSGNYQFNNDYILNSDSIYQDHYYRDYAYNDSYNNLGENFLDSSQLSAPSVRAATPFGDETVEELGPEEVRWFYKVEADKKWTPFIGYDSLRIEWKYRDLLQDVGSEESENSSYRKQWSGSHSPKERQEGTPQEVGRIVVRGGLYEVDVKQHKCESIYWQGEEFIISRGTWFYDTWGPLEEHLADRIEFEHLTHFRGHQLSSQRLDDSTKQVVHSMSLPEGDVDWFSASEVYLSSDATPSRLMRSVGKKLGFQKTGYKLHRGYSIDATSSDKPPDINHIVFVIHGIGQKMERGRIIKNCTGLRENVNYLKQKYYPSIVNSSNTVEFFPVEWRSSLVLDAGIIESITPQKILNIRQMLNASFMDIMYYNSPLYREEIISGLTNEMNRLYTMFTQRNPYFESNKGKVSMVAHSLGCVITYDIVTGWNPARQFDHQIVQSLVRSIDGNKKLQREVSESLKNGLQELLTQHDFNHSQPSLDFKIENFFCLGSPLAVFLALRTKQSQREATDIIPQKLCKRLFNIFHPADPVAYRIEPLLCPEYSNIAPVLIHSYNASEKLPYNEMPLEPITMIAKEKEKDYKEGGDKSRADSENNTPVSSVPSTPVRGGASSWSLWGLMKGSKKSTDPGSSSHEVTSVLQEGRSLTERTDFVLREGSMESSYISAVTSHTAYWTNYDVSHFILSVLYPDIQPTTTTTKPEPSRP